MLWLLSGAGRGWTIPSASGGQGLAPPRLAGRWGGVGGGGSRRGLPAPPLGGGPRFPTLAPLLSSAHSPPACAFGRGRGAAPAWSWGGSWGARPPYCSGAPPCAVPRLGPRAAPARWCGLARRRRPPREQAAGGAGARLAGPAASPPPASRSLLGEGGRPLGSGGAEGRSCGPQAVGGSGGGVGGAAPPPPAPRPVGRRPAIRCLRRAPPGYTRAVGVAGWPWASGAARSAANGSVRRGGEGGGLPRFAPPPSPGRLLKGLLRLRRPGRRLSAVGRQRAWRERAGGSPGAIAAAAVPPHPGCSSLSRGGCGAALSSVCLRPLLGLRGRGGGVGGASGPLAPPPHGRGGAAWRSRPRGPAVGSGVALFPRPPLPRAGPSCRTSLGSLVPPAVAARCWPAGGGREG